MDATQRLFDDSEKVGRRHQMDGVTERVNLPNLIPGDLEKAKKSGGRIRLPWWKFGGLPKPAEC